jgi:tetrahydromethanopterin S-methyltransferase subunit G
MADNAPHDGLTLRELLEVDKKLAVLEAHMKQKMDAAEKALQLQAREYDRRLDALNHEQTRLAVDRERYLPREIYESHLKEIDTKIWTFKKDLDDFKSTVNNYISATIGRDRGIGLSWGVLLGAGTFLIVATALVMKFVGR